MTKLTFVPTFVPAFVPTLVPISTSTATIAQGLLALALAAITAAFSHPAGAASAGDTYVYRVINGYNKETVGSLKHEITTAGTAQGQAVSVTPDAVALGLPRTEIYTADGHWLRHTLDNHGLATEYEFTPALPALRMPAESKSWSVRVNAVALPHSVRRSVRVDGDVLGNERIRVPAGEFDTVKVRRIIYGGDVGDFKTETRVVEIDWYAPALGRSVRSEIRSSWQEPCSRRMCTYHGDWHVSELTEVRNATR
jgi:hypothetical protein